MTTPALHKFRAELVAAHQPDETHLQNMMGAFGVFQPVTLTEPARRRREAAGPAGAPEVQRLRSTALARRASLATACVIAALGVGAAVLALTGGHAVDQASALPILGRPPVNATWLRSKAAVLRREAADFRRAHSVSTPNGAAYVMTARDGRVCLAVPDGGGYGQSCATRDEIDQRGLVVALTTRGSDPMTKLVLILPAATRRPVLHPNGQAAQTLTPTDGVLSLALPGSGNISYQSADGKAVSLPFGQLARCSTLAPGASSALQEKVSKQSGLPPCSARAGGSTPGRRRG